ncbi:MAG TPA: hypothetical protein VFV86_06085 [Nitrososphaeraceae archaeon]|nr:hypothetical protein [Nitrososphaeraceae archaeon]
MSSTENENKIYESNDGHFTIVAVYEGRYVRYSRGLEKEEVVPEDISTVEEFEKMLHEEGWREVTSSRK